METKKCAKCGLELPIEQFSTNKNSSDGYSHMCKDCLSQAHSVRQKTPKEPNPLRPLAGYTPRQLMEELRYRGYSGELTYTQRIKLSAI